jgi:hypothetical protein
VKTFTFQDFDGEIIQGAPDEGLLNEALSRVRHARTSLQSQKLDILEFPFAPHSRSGTAQDIFIRYHRVERYYEIKIFEFGPYNARKIVGHFLLREPKPDNRYSMTLS